MTVSNWIELAVIIITVIILGVPLLRITKKVADLDGAELVESKPANSDLLEGIIISGK